MPAVIRPANRDYPVALRAGVDFRAPGCADPCDREPEPMPPDEIRMQHRIRRAQREGRFQVVHVDASSLFRNLGPTGPVTVTGEGDC